MAARKFAKDQDGLTHAQRKFCDAYLENDMNAYKASIALGKTEKTAKARGWIMLKKPAVIAFLAKVKEKNITKAMVSFEDNLRDLSHIAKQNIDSRPGKAIQAIAEINKMCGYYAAEKRVNTNLNLDADVQEVKEIMEELIKKYKREY